MKSIWNRAVFFLLILVSATLPAHAVVQWARQYKMPCTGCHTVFPRLNETGILFRKLGYRFTEDLPKATPMDFIGPTTTPSFTVRSDRSSVGRSHGLKIHVGGALPDGNAFLVQPTPGDSESFQLIQGMRSWRDRGSDWRLVAGRLSAWGSGGAGATDRFPTATLPVVLAPLQGVAPNSLGGGFRLERDNRHGITWAAFSTDMSASGHAAPTLGTALAFARQGQRVELALAQSRVQGAQTSRVMLTGFYEPAIEGARLQYLWGALYGSGSGPRLGAGFAEVDWYDGHGMGALLRLNGLMDSHNARHGVVLGVAQPLSPAARLDIDVAPRRIASTEPRVTARLRLVY